MPHAPTSARARLRPTALHQRIQYELRERIVAGQLAPASQIPTESALMALYGVSRITVRHALGALEKDQLIYKVPGKGTFVTAPKPYQKLGRLQGFAEAMGAQGHEPFNHVVSIRHLAASAEVAQRLALRLGDPVTELRRVRYLDRQPVSLDVTWVPQALGLRLEAEDLATRDIFLILENDYGWTLGYADLAIDAVAAEAGTAELLNVPVGTPLLRVDRLTHSRDGTPLDYEHLYCRSDNFQYRLRIDRHTTPI